MRIDVHTHAFPPHVAEKFVAFLGNFYNCSCTGDGTVQTLEATETKEGMDRYILLNAANTAGQVIPANDFALEVRKNKNLHAIPFGTIHPDFSDWESELERLEKGGIRGLKIHPNLQGFSMDDPRLYPIFEACSGRFLILFHVGSRNPNHMAALSSPYTVRRVLALFPNLEIIAAHIGACHMWEIAPEVYKNVRSDKLWFDTSSSARLIPQCTKEFFRQLLNIIPRERYLFGTDWPIVTPAQEIDFLMKNGGMTESDIDQIMNNADSLLRRYGML